MMLKDYRGMILIAANVLYVKINDQDEIASTDITHNLIFLGLTESPSLLNNYRDESVQDGQLWNYSRYGATTVTAKFVVTFIDRKDYKLAKHEIYRVFAQKGIFRLRTAVEPDKVRYCRSTAFELAVNPEDPNYCEFEVPFENPRGLIYSRINTDKMTDENFLSLNLNLEAQRRPYHFYGSSTFRIYNAGDIAVDPEMQNHDLRITMKHNGGKFTITNETTKTSWTYNKNLTGNDTVVLNGINTYKNDALDSVSTDYGYITLAPGWNEFSVNGANDLDITFSFPYMYLGQVVFEWD